MYPEQVFRGSGIDREVNPRLKKIMGVIQQNIINKSNPSTPLERGGGGRTGSQPTGWHLAPFETAFGGLRPNLPSKCVVNSDSVTGN